MRIFNLICFALMGFVSCGPVNKNEAVSIAFMSRPVQSQSLLVIPTLACFPGEQRLELNLTLKNLLSEKIAITEISLNNSIGIKSLAESLGVQSFSITENGDTTMLLTFKPVNDKELFQATGLRGLTDSTYYLSVFYSVEGKEGVRVVNLVSRMLKETFLVYRKLYDAPVQIYQFNTANDFDEKQRKFLQTNVVSETPPFVHITEREVAVSGLNFRIKCFHLKDTLYAEIFAVNHSDMTIRIDTSKMDMIIDGLQGEISNTQLSNVKITGKRDETDILRKGDRTIIRMRKYVRENPERLWFAFSESFFLATGKPLFNDDLELIRTLRSHGPN